MGLPARPAATVGRVQLLRTRSLVLQAAPESAAEPQANGLPEGWATATDDEGSTYYWNKETKETTWHRPLCGGRRAFFRHLTTGPWRCHGVCVCVSSMTFRFAVVRRVPPASQWCT